MNFMNENSYLTIKSLANVAALVLFAKEENGFEKWPSFKILTIKHPQLTSTNYAQFPVINH